MSRHWAAGRFRSRAAWTSGYELAEGADLLVHDAQYTADEYEKHVGWGHSSIDHALAFADMAKVGRLVTFHHDPEHDDATIDRLVNEARRSSERSFEVIGGTEGASFEIG